MSILLASSSAISVTPIIDPIPAVSGTVAGASITCTFTIKTDGTWEFTVNNGSLSAFDGNSGTSGVWLQSGANTADYKALISTSGGTLTTNSMSSYNQVSGNLTATKTQSSIGTSQFIGTLTIARNTDEVPIVGKTFIIDLERTS